MNELRDDANFIIPADCVLVKGVMRSIICDFTRNKYSLIPNSLYELLTEHSSNTFKEIKDLYDNEYHTYIDEYHSFLYQNEYIFYCNKDLIPLFPKINLDHQTPSIIDNFIIDIYESSDHLYEKIFTELQDLNCFNVQIRVFSLITRAELNILLKSTIQKDFQFIHLLMPYNKDITYMELCGIADEYGIRKIDIHGTPNNFLQEFGKANDSTRRVFYFNKIVDSETHCGIVSEDYFSINIPMFAEAQHSNTCLNKKVSIDKNGFIKNCPSMLDNFGHHYSNTLQEVVMQNDFKNMWNINKDQISICKDCEFRYICIDCRAYTKESSNKYSKPFKCGYDPYTNSWE